MSYEGYTQGLCAHGHYYMKDAYDAWPDVFACGAPLVWSHEVDQTNGDGAPVLLTVCVPATFDRCNLGHVHVVTPPRYHIPAASESREKNTGRTGSPGEKNDG